MDHDPRNVCVFGNSSLNIMYDLVSHGFFARLSRREAWRELKDVSWLCPVPGYDRHFAITELFGIKMIPVRMNENGPDMDEIEALVREKTMLSREYGASPSTLTREASHTRTIPSHASHPCPALRVPDFRIFWDNAYCVHHLYDTRQPMSQTSPKRVRRPATRIDTSNSPAPRR